jgi:hypothetical protein
VRGTRTGIQQGEESSETPTQVLVQTAPASESVDGPEKEEAGKVDGGTVGRKTVEKKKSWMNYFSPNVG